MFDLTRTVQQVVECVQVGSRLDSARSSLYESTVVQVVLCVVVCVSVLIETK